MIWLIGIGCLLGGAIIGALLFKVLLSDEARVRVLEEQLQALSEEHESYKSNVAGNSDTLPAPPLDYAARTESGKKGSLDEDYGFKEPTQH